MGHGTWDHSPQLELNINRRTSTSLLSSRVIDAGIVIEPIEMKSRNSFQIDDLRFVLGIVEIVIEINLFIALFLENVRVRI